MTAPATAYQQAAGATLYLCCIYTCTWQKVGQWAENELCMQSACKADVPSPLLGLPSKHTNLSAVFTHESHDIQENNQDTQDNQVTVRLTLG